MAVRDTLIHTHSLTHSLTHLHTNTHTHTKRLRMHSAFKKWRFVTHTYTLTHSLTHEKTQDAPLRRMAVRDSLSLSLSLSLSHTHTHTHTLIDSSSLIPSIPTSLSLSLSLSHTHTHRFVKSDPLYSDPSSLQPVPRTARKVMSLSLSLSLSCVFVGPLKALRHEGRTLKGPGPLKAPKHERTCMRMCICNVYLS